MRCRKADNLAGKSGHSCFKDEGKGPHAAPPAEDSSALAVEPGSLASLFSPSFPLPSPLCLLPPLLLRAVPLCPAKGSAEPQALLLDRISEGSVARVLPLRLDSAFVASVLRKRAGKTEASSCLPVSVISPCDTCSQAPRSSSMSCLKAPGSLSNSN